MKKNFRIAMVAMVMAVAGYGVYQGQTEEKNLSELALANIEALASGENGSKHTLDCEKSGIKACSATCNKCNVTLTSYGNGTTVTIICYQ